MKHLTNYITGLLLALLLLATGCAGSAAGKVNEGNDAFAKAAYEEAQAQYEAAQIEEPELAEPYYNAANALYRQGNYSAALEQMQKALAYADQDVLAGQGLLQSGQHRLQPGRYGRGGRGLQAGPASQPRRLRTPNTIWSWPCSSWLNKKASSSKAIRKIRAISRIKRIRTSSSRTSNLSRRTARVINKISSRAKATNKTSSKAINRATSSKVTRAKRAIRARKASSRPTDRSSSPVRTASRNRRSPDRVTRPPATNPVRIKATALCRSPANGCRPIRPASFSPPLAAAARPCRNAWGPFSPVAAARRCKIGKATR